ncbi:MAG: GNAT family N-acetyltransferase [Alphaproteobacteria bacterium]|nr:GNAT family N-acetyltransferase [Alphaproteobacteria bacterium]
MKTNRLTIKKLSSKTEILSTYPILKQRYLWMSLESFEEQISEMMARNNFKMVGAFLGDKLVGVSGYWILRMLYCGRYIQVSSFIVEEEKRGLGIGQKILKELQKIGRELGCEKIILDSFTENKKSHPLYFREGFHIRGFHFMKDL